MQSFKYLKWLLLFMLTLGASFLTLSYTKTHGQPYNESIDSALIPMYRSVTLDFVHEYDTKSLSFIGSAVFDLDGDGRPELFLGGGRNQQDGLFRYVDGDFALIEGATDHMKSGPDATYGVAAADMDMDGDTDLLVARDSGVTLYLNEGGKLVGNVLDIPFDDKSTPMSFALADLDRDGWLDMFVATYLPVEKMEGLNIFNKEGYGSNSLLLMNRGDNSFRDATLEAGLNYTHNTFQGVFVDIDDDDELDLVVAHDTGHVKTWKNLGGGKFKDMPNPTTDVFGYPMGVAVGDADNDGRVDFFFSNTGGTAPHFLAKGDLRDDQVFEDRLIFLHNDGGFRFTNVNVETKTADYEFSWGTVFHDLNLDGRQDLIISQNYIDLPTNKFFKLPGRVLVQRPDGTFGAVESEAGAENRAYELTSLVADFNGDGYPDMVRVNLAGRALALIHKGGKNHYVQVKLPATARTFGAKVQVTLPSGKTLTDWLVAGEGLGSDQTHVLTFGLGDETSATEIRVRYPDGSTQRIANPRVDSVVVVDPGTVSGVDAGPFDAAIQGSEVER